MKNIKKVIWIFLFISTQSCGVIKKNIETGVDVVINRLIVIPVAVSKSISQAASTIYHNDTLKNGTVVLLKEFNINFYTKKDSLLFHLNDIEFSFVKDTLRLNNFEFPKWDFNKYADTMRSSVSCYYTTPSHIETRCLKNFYTIINGQVSSQSNYKMCVQ